MEGAVPRRVLGLVERIVGFIVQVDEQDLLGCEDGFAGKEPVETALLQAAAHHRAKQEQPQHRAAARPRRRAQDARALAGDKSHRAAVHIRESSRRCRTTEVGCCPGLVPV